MIYSSYLVVACLEDKGWLPQGSKKGAWDAVQTCWYTVATADGQMQLVSKRSDMVYGKEYEEDDDDDDADDDNDRTVAPSGYYLASDGRIYPRSVATAPPPGSYIASDGRTYPLQGYYLASDGHYYPLPTLA